MITSALGASSQAARAPQAFGDPAAAVRASVRRDIADPLAVLRASIEALSANLAGEQEPRAVLGGALEQLAKLGHNVQALMDFAVPPELHTLSCSLEELARAAREQLEDPIATRFEIACDADAPRVLVDGPNVSRRIAHLVAARAYGLEAVLVRARLVDGEPCLSLYLRTAERRAALPEESEHLALHLAQRELERMGGRVDILREDPEVLALAFYLPGDSEDRG